MAKAADLCRERFGRLLVISRELNDARGNSRWMCICDCGKQSYPLGQSLRSGATTSCGCYAAERAASAKSHGASSTADYKSWHAMIQRCTNPKNHKWRRYGGRGIAVCREWMSYAGFVKSMGERPPGMSIDRIDNDGNYEIGNCRWATPAQQASNRSTNVFVMVGDESLTASDASRRIGKSRSTVSRRIRDGWSQTDAVSIPLNNIGSK